jgi:hypothetical protein
LPAWPRISWQNRIYNKYIYFQAWFSVSPFKFSSQFIGSAGLDWKLVGTADLFGDKLPELIWRNQNTGEVRAWRLRGAVIIADVSLGFAPLDWKIAGFGDFTGTGREDILWRNTTDVRLMPGSWMDLPLALNGSPVLSRSTGGFGQRRMSTETVSTAFSGRT